MVKSKNEKAVLRKLLEWIMEVLRDLKQVRADDENQFAYGEKTAYVECLEWIQKLWEKSKKYGLDFDIEKEFPL